MLSIHKVGVPSLALVLFANVAAAQTTTVRLSPVVGRPQKGAALVLPQREPLPALEIRDRAAGGRRDSVWNGLLIGAGVGAAGGAIWGRNICGSNDSECLAIAGPVGILGGAGIGAVIGAIADALHD